MPQLYSRPDESGWLTPSMADILVQGTSPLIGDDSIREQVLEVQRLLNAEGTPVRAVDVRSSPSRTLLVVRADTSSRRGSKRPTPADIRRGLSTVADQQPNWTIGFINMMSTDSENMGILLRTDQHQPLKLRQLIISGPFTHHPASTAVIMGVDVEQHIIVHDLAELGHMVVYGPSGSRIHLLRTLFTTLLMFNTPAELRLALVGKADSHLEKLANAPHILGKVIETPDAGLRLLEGMVREADHRWQSMTEHSADSFAAYNDALRQRGEPEQPRLIVLFDSPTLPEWAADQERWSSPLYDLLINGPRVGIHPIIVLDKPDDELPLLINDVIKNRLFMRSVAGDLIDQIKHLHPSALRFLDAIFVQENEPSGLELCTVATDDMQRLTHYWQQAQAKRTAEQRMRDNAGLTDVEAITPPAAPVPQPSRPTAVARAAQVFTGTDEERLIAQAQALAAYLGWIGIGPLRDVLGLSSGEARAVLATLQQRAVIEPGEGAVYRFVRLADNPYTSH